MSSAGYAEAFGTRTAPLFGRVMGLVAVTVGFATLGVYLVRNPGGAAWFVAWLLALGCLVGLNVANARGQARPRARAAVRVRAADGRERRDDGQLLLRHRPDGGASGVRGDGAVRRGAWAPAATRSAATSRSCTGSAFWLLLVLILAGIVLIFVDIPAAYTAYALVGLVIFGLYTVVDFNRLRRAGSNEAIPLAAGIFLDILNIFLLFLRLFARSN